MCTHAHTHTHTHAHTHSGIYAVAFQPLDFGTFFLSILLTNFILLLCYYIAAKCVYGERPSFRPFFFLLLSLTCWAAGIYFYTLVSCHGNGRRLGYTHPDELPWQWGETIYTLVTAMAMEKAIHPGSCRGDNIDSYTALLVNITISRYCSPHSSVIR